MDDLILKQTKRAENISALFPYHTAPDLTSPRRTKPHLTNPNLVTPLPHIRYYNHFWVIIK